MDLAGKRGEIIRHLVMSANWIEADANVALR